MTLEQMKNGIASGRRTQAIQLNDTVRFFINSGFAGFNSHANNRNGYSSEEAAIAASLEYQGTAKLNEVIHEGKEEYVVIGISPLALFQRI